MNTKSLTVWVLSWGLALMALTSHAALAQELTGSVLVGALRTGGYVIVVRHARSPRQAPDARTANPDNTTRERQLDATGRADAISMGKAMRALRIPIGRVLTSPAYRALETVRLAQWTQAEIIPELGDRGQSMQGVTAVESRWLQDQVAQFQNGTNTIIVTHLPNITQAFPSDADVEDGDALVFGPSAGNKVAVVGRIKASEWVHLSE